MNLQGFPMIRTRLLLVATLAAGCATAPEVKPAPTGPVAVAAPVEPTASEHLAAGLRALQAKDLAAAQDRLGKAVAKDAKLFVAHYNLGLIAQGEGRLDAAAASYELALGLEPEHEATTLNLGKVYRDQQAYAKGIALFEKACARKPFDVNYLNNLSVFYRLAKRYDQAVATVRKLLSRTKDNADAYKNLALIAYDQEQLRLAEFIGANAKKLDAKDPGVLNNLGLVYVKLGDRRGALAQFRKAVELDADFAPGHANIGALALSYRDYDGAAAAFERVTRLDPTNAAAHLNLAWSYEGMRQKDGSHRTKEAVAEFEKVLSLVKDQPDAVYGIARAYAGELRDLPRAKEFYDRFLPLASGPAKEKAQRELAVLEQRIKAGAEADRRKKEQEEKKRAAEEEKRKKAQEAAKTGGSMLDKISEQAEQQEQPAEQAPEGAPSPTPDAPQGAAPKADAPAPVAPTK